jgi:hypothetical protein
MQVTLEKKVERAFMSILSLNVMPLKRTRQLIRLTIALFCLIGCQPDRSDDVIPYQAFGSIYVNMNLPEYASLRATGNSQYLTGGVKGIILYRASANTIYAFERNCSFQPNEACSTVEIHISGLYMEDPCCASVFDFTGNPTGGPAWRKLNRYDTQFDGSTLTITDQLVD